MTLGVGAGIPRAVPRERDMLGQKGRKGASLRRWEPRPASGDVRAYAVAASLVAAALLFRWTFRAWFGSNVPWRRPAIEASFRLTQSATAL